MTTRDIRLFSPSWREIQKRQLAQDLDPETGFPEFSRGGGWH